MRKPFLAVAILLFITGTLGLNAQDTTYTFGNVKVGTTDSITFRINPDFSLPIEVICDFDAFDVKKEQDSIKVYFSPNQNVAFNGELIIRAEYADEYNFVYQVIDLRGDGRLNDPYYSSTFDLRDEALKNELHNIIDGHNSLGYSAARDEMYMDIDNQKVNGQGAAVNTLEGVYTGNFAVGYNNRQDAQSNYNFNTEHTFPQGTFNKDEPMRSDIHHLFPTKVYANSERGNKPFGMVSNPTWQEGGSRSDNSTFEPRDVQKGPTARAMLYFLIRYQNYQNYVSNQDQKVLMDWAETYAPTEIERRRNDDIYQVQNNRNPFVDYPRFLDRIHNFIGTSSTPEIRDYYYSSDTFRYVVDSRNYRFSLVNTGNVTLNITDITTNVTTATIDSFSSTVAPGESGSFHLRASDFAFGDLMVSFANGKTDTIKLKAGFPEGIAEFNVKKLRIHPNPASNRIELINPLNEPVNAEIYSVSGRLVKSMFLTPGSSTVSTNSFKSGVYFLKFINDQTTYTGKFLIIE